MFDFSIPSEVLSIINTIEKAGYEAWLVGGCVRDMIMDNKPFDYDVTTNALPETILGLFKKVVPTGIMHGTVTVITENYSIEVTTYRCDGSYVNHRKPEDVKYVTTVDEDLLRRDFTMNAICYNPNKGLYDITDGIKDINSKTIKAIGNPEKRFFEDALRIMRCFRFSAQLNFEIEANTYNSALNSIHLLRDISSERIFLELTKGLLSQHPEKFCDLIYNNGLNFLGLLGKKQINFHKASPILALRLAIVIKQTNSCIEAVLKNINCSTKIKNETKVLYSLMEIEQPTKAEIKRLLQICSSELLFALFEYRNFELAKNNLEEILNNNEPYKISMLNINGDELKSLGISGKGTGEILNYLLEKCISDPNQNTKENLIKQSLKFKELN